MSVTPKAIWYVESHLDSELSLQEIAEAVGVSRFHLSRAFAVSTGISLAGYIRARRVGGAAKALAEGAPDILSVALDARSYDLHEAFSRAFRQHFGLTPEQLREQAHFDNITLQEPIKMHRETSTALIPPRLAAPRLVQEDTLLIFGISQRCPQVGDPAIPSLWSRFAPYLGHIEGQIGSVAYGAIHKCDEAGAYDYICGVAVDRFPAHPAEFTRLSIPPQSYAVFEHGEHVSTIASTWKAIWEQGLTKAGYQASDGPSFERYDERFDGRTGLGGLEIWVPVKG